MDGNGWMVFISCVRETGERHFHSLLLGEEELSTCLFLFSPARLETDGIQEVLSGTYCSLSNSVWPTHRWICWPSHDRLVHTSRTSSIRFCCWEKHLGNSDSRLLGCWPTRLWLVVFVMCCDLDFSLQCFLGVSVHFVFLECRITMMLLTARGGLGWKPKLASLRQRYCLSHQCEWLFFEVRVYGGFGDTVW